MKKVIKSRIFLVIITMIICISGTLYAANTYKASDVLYTTSDGSSMTVNEALNELYNKSGNKGYYYSYKNGTAIYYNPVSGEICNASEAVSTTGTKTGCMKWYAFNDSSESTTVNMILDHNTTAILAWNTEGTYGKNVAYEESNIKPEVDKLVSESKWKDTPRLISMEEIVQITGKIDFISSDATTWFYFDSTNQTLIPSTYKKSKYAWLYDYTSGCISKGCNTEDSSTSGYWTSTPVGNSGSGTLIWDINTAILYGNYASGLYINAGIRPVITISKSKLS